MECFGTSDKGQRNSNFVGGTFAKKRKKRKTLLLVERFHMMNEALNFVVITFQMLEYSCTKIYLFIGV
jgi:hypothetical protein